MAVTISKKELKSVVRESVKETLAFEMTKLRAFLTPYVSSREQKNVEKLYGSPSKKSAKTIKTNI